MYSNRLLLGSLLALFSAATFALNLVLASKAYEYGANVHSQNLARATMFLGTLLVVVHLRAPAPTLNVKDHMLCGLVGLLLCAEMYILLIAIQTIPVAVAVLIFYTYPLIIAIVGWVMRTDPFSYVLLGLLFSALFGVAIVLIDAPVTLAFEGVALSCVAAAVMAAMLFTSEKALNKHDNFHVLLTALTVVTVFILVISMTVVSLEYPKSSIGWVYYLGSALFYVMATFCLFIAVSMVGPLRTAIIDTTSPVWAILFGLLLLQQTLTHQQLLGAVVVVASVICLHYFKSRTHDSVEETP